MVPGLSSKRKASTNDCDGQDHVRELKRQHKIAHVETPADPEPVAAAGACGHEDPVPKDALAVEQEPVDVETQASALTDEVNASAPDMQRYDVSGLRYATECWQGMKSSNEDRHFTVLDRFPGPVFGVLDGHGGIVTVDMLMRNLVKNMSSAVKQEISVKQQDALLKVYAQSTSEQTRQSDIAAQMELFKQQIDQVEMLIREESPRDETTAAKSDTGSSSPSKLEELKTQLKSTVKDIEECSAQIDKDERARETKIRAWWAEQSECFQHACIEGFKRTDAQVLQKNPTRDGSTALLVWFCAHPSPSETSFYTVNLGDSRAVLCRGGHAIPLTSDHKPDRPDERQRIQKAGGFVGNFGGIPRVYSASGAGLAVESQLSMYLAVSRAFGDRPLKTPSALVSCEPEIKRFQVDNDDLFIVMACDGIWDVMSNQDAVNIALAQYNDPKAAADAIVKEAYKRGSADNLTATVIQFGWQDEQAKTALENLSKQRPTNHARLLPVNRRMAAVLAAENNDAAAGETTENQEDDDDDEEEEIDMFSL